MQGGVAHITAATKAALAWKLAVTLDVGGDYGEGGDVEGEEKEEEHVDEEERPDEVVLELQERLR